MKKVLQNSEANEEEHTGQRGGQGQRPRGRACRRVLEIKRGEGQGRVAGAQCTAGGGFKGDLEKWAWA